MNIKSLRSTFLALILIYSFAGCSKSNAGTSTPTPPPTTDQSYTVSDMVVYEVNPRLYNTPNALSYITKDLDRIKSLGSTVVWLMPIQTPGSLKSVGSPYCVRDYKGVNAQYGTISDLKTLVQTAHNKGLKVIIDWVANHTSWDHPWITDHKDWYTQDAAGNIISPQGMGWNDVADLNFNNSSMRTAMIESMIYWIKEADIDGFRFDYAEGVPVDFWKEAITQLRKQKEGLVLLAEGGDVALMNAGFDLLYGWGFQGKLQDYYKGTTTLTNILTTNTSELSSMPKDTYRLRYTTNHDKASEESPIQSYGGEKGALSAFVISTMLEGVPLIYSSQEIGYSTKLSFFEYKPLDLTQNAAYASEMKKIISAYKATKDVRGGELQTTTSGKILTISRKAGDHGMLVMVNTSAQEAQVKVPIQYAGTTMSNLLTSGQEKLPAAYTLAPFQYLIFKK